MRLSISPDVLDLLVTGDGSAVVMVGTRVLVLTAVSSALLVSIRDGVTGLDQLVEVTAGRRGGVEETAEGVRRQLDELVEAGVLVSD